MNDEPQDFLAAIESLRSYLKLKQSKGFNWIPYPAELILKTLPPEEEGFVEVDNSPSFMTDPLPPASTAAKPAFKNDKSIITKTDALKKIPLQSQNLNAKVAFIRLSPSEQEYRDSTPFSDEAAKILDVIVEKIGWDNKMVYKDYFCPYPIDFIAEDSKNISAWKHDLLERLNQQQPAFVMLFSERLSGIFFKSDKDMQYLRQNPLRHHSGMTFFASWDPFYFMKITKFKRPVWEDINKINNLLK